MSYGHTSGQAPSTSVAFCRVPPYAPTAESSESSGPNACAVSPGIKITHRPALSAVQPSAGERAALNPSSTVIRAQRPGSGGTVSNGPCSTHPHSPPGTHPTAKPSNSQTLFMVPNA